MKEYCQMKKFIIICNTDFQNQSLMLILKHVSKASVYLAMPFDKCWRLVTSSI